MFNVIAGSPGSPAQHLQHVMSTPSPRPSILRKRGDTLGTPGASAKRRLPFMHEASSSPSNSAQLASHCNPGPPSQTVLLNAECNNGNTEESPRKRMRKQQFETDTIPDQIKMAIDVVQPVAANSEMWTFSDHSGLMESFALMGVTEKRKRGRPRTSSRPATVLPIEMHQSVSVFVDIDSPEEGQNMSFTTEPKPFRGSASSVPPVHLDGTKCDLREGSDKLQIMSADNSTKPGTVSTEECISLLNFWQREKSKCNSSTPRVRHRMGSGSGIGNPSSKPTLFLDDKEANDAVSFLIRCLKESKKERHIRQQLWSVLPSTLNCDTFFGLYSTSTCRTKRLRCERAPAIHNYAASNVDPSVNHFQTLNEFKERYGSYRKLKLRPQEFRLSSSTCLERTHKVALSNLESSPKAVEDLVDEIVSFLAREESPCTTSECIERLFVRETIGGVVTLQKGHNNAERTLLSRRSRARMLLEDTFHSVLESMKLITNENVKLGNNVSTLASAHRRCRRLPIGSRRKRKSIISQNACCCSLLQTPYKATFELNALSINGELSIRVQHMDRHLGEQMNFEESVLGTFEHLYGVHNRKDTWDYDSGIKSCDTRISSLHNILARPPVLLPPDRKLDFGDQCGNVINCPDESEMNQHMLGISPFWRRPTAKVSSKNSDYTPLRTTMHDGCASSYALQHGYREYYLEDLIDHRQPARFRIDYYRMEQIWSYLEGFNIPTIKLPLEKNSMKGDSISRRNRALFKKEQAVTSAFVQEDAKEVPGCDDNMPSGERKNYLDKESSAHEILATAFKAIHQTTMIMIQTRNAILELLHNLIEESNEDEEDQDDSVDEEEEFNRQMEQAIQESCQEVQSSSRAVH